MNAQADDMCRRALASGGTVEFYAGQVPVDAPQLDVAALHAAVEELRQSSSRAFAICAIRGVEEHVGADLDPDSSDDDAAPDFWEAQDPASEGPVVAAAWDERLLGVPCKGCGGL
jgi:hypothetical protein